MSFADPQIDDVSLYKYKTDIRWFFRKKAKKALTFLKEVFHPLCSLVKILRIWDKPTGTPKNFSDFRFAEYIKNCGIAIVDLRIANS
jgi:hypothetical protein